jgi:site-specific DNA recombinase
MNAIYARVSTEEQAKSGYSIDSQILACRKFLIANNLIEAEIYKDDGYSGEFLERPALEQMRTGLYEKIINHVVVFDPDRLSRKLSHMLLLADEIKAAGAELHFITGDYDASSEGKLFFSLRGAIAEFEKDKIRERTVRGKRSKALAGKLTHNDKTFGYDYDKGNFMYVVNENEAETVRKIFDLYTTQGYGFGLRSLRAELNANGIVNRQGKPFTLSNLQRILSNEAYAGTKWSFKRYDKTIGQHKKKQIKRDKSEWIPIIVPAIISPETFEKAKQCRSANTIRATRNAKHDYLLRNIIKCPLCGYSMSGQHTKWYEKDYYYYRCSAQTHDFNCPNTAYIPADELDAMVWDIIVATKKEGRSFKPAEVKQNSNEKYKLEKYLDELYQKQAAMLRWVRDGTIGIGAADKELQSLNKEIAATQAALSIYTAEKVKVPTTEIPLEQISQANTFEQKRKVVLGLGITILAEKKGKEINWSFRI